MKVEQLSLNELDWLEQLSSISIDANLFLLFISPEFKSKQKVIEKIREQYPVATLVGCSTAGEIFDISVKDNTISLTAIKMEKVSFNKESIRIHNMEDSFHCGQQLSKQLYREDLKHVLVFSDGLNVNGADLVNGMKLNLPEVSITGGLAGDGPKFSKTFVLNDDELLEHAIVALGFYGEGLIVGYGTKGGWDTFGMERLVTRSYKNTLFELDGKPALEIYKSYLGELAHELPCSGLLFPLSMRYDSAKPPIVRTILSVNEAEQSLTFAGNIPEGSYVKLVKANHGRLIYGAEDSAKIAETTSNNMQQLAILISCVGRRLVLKQLVEEEVEVVHDVLGEKTLITGFYSYGEIAPFNTKSSCELHNQSMTITTLSEC